jgi:hypothetical protein
MELQDHSQTHGQVGTARETQSASAQKPRRKAIIAAVAEVFDVPAGEMVAKGRRSMAVAFARYAAMMLIKEIWGISKTRIGQDLGGLDHSSIFSGLRKGYRLAQSDPDFAVKVDAARALVFSRPTEPPPASFLVRVATSEPRAGENPPAVKFEASTAASRPYRFPRTVADAAATAARMAAKAKPSVGDVEWWAVNDRRFRAAMASAHPELVRASSEGVAA